MEHVSVPAPPRPRQWAVDRSGATAIEYALIASVISIVIILAVALIGGELQNIFNSVANAF